MVNAARSPTFYEFDSGDLLRLYRDMDARDEEPVVIYHSHTATEAYPSRTDISYASEPDAHYVLVSTRETGTEPGRTSSARSASWTVSSRRKKFGSSRRWTRSSPIPDRSARRRQPPPHSSEETHAMAVEVSIPTILRSYTGGAKAVEAAGATLDEAVADLESRHPGPARAAGRGRRAAPLRQRLRQRRGRPLPRRAGHPARRRRHRDDPARRRRRRRRRALTCATTRCSTPSAVRRWSGCRGCRRRPTYGCGPSSRTATRPGSVKDRPALRDGRGGRGVRAARRPAARSSSRRRATPASRSRWRPSSRATG